ncbi:MAG TPA: isochorismatase family cysteine hydrolase [Burkholderiales bacterium]|nr:isochorismatase family cysteine hydrolase [Burkholderiales bacterium]
MHPYSVPDHVRQRVLGRKGKPLSLEAIDCARAALLVVDMQNYFVAPGFPQEVPVARAIVPAINRMAAAMRSAGGTVAWIQTTATGALETWGNHHRYGMSPEVAARRLATLAEDAEGYRLWHALEPSPVDLRVKKIKFSAMLPGSSDLHETLSRRGVDTVLVAGTTTNVCCESTARDAMMLDYRVAMLSDATAARSDEEHAASLNTFHIFFGDVMTVDEASARLVPLVRARTA